MNILMTSDSYLPLIGGAEYHIFYVQQELIKQGCNVELFVTYSGTNKPDDSVVSHKYTSIWSILPIFKKIWVHSKKADIIHSHYSYRLSCIAATVAFLRRKPFVITQHGMGLLPQAQATFLQNIVFTVWRFWSQTVAKIIISTSDDLSLEIKKGTAINVRLV